VIDLHTHVAPARVDGGRDRDRLWPCIEPRGAGESAIVIDGALFRMLDTRSWDGAHRVADMSAEGVTAQVLSPMPELLSFWLPVDDAVRLADVVNTQITETAAAAPDRFHLLGMITAQAPALAVEQLAVLRERGFRGVEIGTHIAGRPLGDSDLWPIYEAAEALDMAIFVHPLHPVGGDRIGGDAQLCAAATFPLEIALAAISIIGGGVFERFPRLRMLLSHGGGALQVVLPRLAQAWALSPQIKRQIAREPHTYARQFWYDSNVYGAAVLQTLAASVGAERIVVGSDYPYLIRQVAPGAFVDAALPGAMPKCAAAAHSFLFGGSKSEGGAHHE